MNKKLKGQFWSKLKKLVKLCIDGWTNDQVDLNKIIVTDIKYIQVKFDGDSYFIEFDIKVFLKSLKNEKSWVSVALRQHL